MSKRYAGYLVLFGILLGVIAGCGGPDVYRSERFSLDSQFKKQYHVPADYACESAKRALLSQGYALDDNLDKSVKAHKQFQPEDETMTVLEFSVICMANRNGSILFANAVESIYRLKKTGGSVGVGVSSLGSIKLPWGKEVDSLVKTVGMTVDDKRFYKRFFDLVEEMIREAKRGEAE